ncbi:MAG: branched-chain amino acid ABC transporter permease [Chromatiales bacterium]|nr:branched-chain amino acid ABC transporter permease [Chromatiales bacterium]
MTEFLIYLITIAGIWGILSLSLNFQYGLTGLLNLGHVGFFMLGAYTSTILVVLAGLPIIVGMVAAVAAAALLGMLMALPTANLQQDYWAISTLAAAEIIRIIFLNTPLGGPYVGEAFGVSGIPRPLRELFTSEGYNLFYMWLVLTCLVLCYLLVVWLSHMPFGRTLKAIREGDDIPLALGKRVSSFRIRAMMVGGALGGFAGALFAHYNAYIAPEYFLPLETFIVWAMVILGGAGNFLGSLVGTFIIQAIYNSTRFLAGWVDIEASVLGPLRMIFISVLIIAVIIYMPKGLLPERRRRYDHRPTAKR